MRDKSECNGINAEYARTPTYHVPNINISLFHDFTDTFWCGFALLISYSNGKYALCRLCRCCLPSHIWICFTTLLRIVSGAKRIKTMQFGICEVFSGRHANSRPFLYSEEFRSSDWELTNTVRSGQYPMTQIIRTTITNHFSTAIVFRCTNYRCV